MQKNENYFNEQTRQLKYSFQVASILKLFFINLWYAYYI